VHQNFKGTLMDLLGLVEKSCGYAEESRKPMLSKLEISVQRKESISLCK
jgi:hypothetical protein